LQDYELIDAFELGAIDGAEFPHERHVRVARALAQRYGRADGLPRLIAGLRAMAARAGRPEAYHETITRAWYELIASAEDLERAPELFDKRLLSHYYSSARLAAGRDRWLEPDLHPLRLPAPPSADVDLPRVMRRVPTAVAVLATHANGTVHGTTVSSLTSVSRSPAVISICVANGTRTLDLIRRSDSFAVSVLAAGQESLAIHFASAERRPGSAQFAGVPHRQGTFGPVLEDAAAWIECELDSTHPCGDHHIVLGKVTQAEATAHNPLLSHGGAYF
jgi:flavin reductase (DIM6/NTAB) family NADH-FMN oxidoreductase RutF